MASDDMDWVPTTPLPLFNPYADPHYIPGGWPESPSASRCTAGVFVRKRKREPTLVWRAAKRVCHSLALTGSITVRKSKAAYRIVIEYRERRRQEVHRRRRGPQPVQTSSATDFNICAFAAPQPNLPSQFIVSQPPTPSEVPVIPRTTFDPLDIDTVPALVWSASAIPNTESKVAKSLEKSQSDNLTPSTQNNILKHTPTVSSTTNTEIRAGCYHIQEDLIQNSPCVAAAKAGIKRRRSQELDPEEIYSALQDTGVRARSFEPTPTCYSTGSTMGPKRVRVNRFDSSQQKAVSPVISEDTVGTRLENPQNDTNLCQLWYSVKPINITPPPSPSGQMQQELQQSAMKPKARNPLHTSQTANLESQEINESKFKRAPTSPIEHDNRWTSIRLPEDYYADEAGSPSAPIESIDSNPKESVLASTSKLFHANEAQNTPPPVRSRSAYSSAALQPASSDIPNEPVSQPRTDETPARASESVPATVAHNLVNGVSEVACSQDIIKAVPPPAAEQKPDANLATPARKENEIFASQTPSQQLANLSLQDGDTPKATPHSGTKTVRKTRYREAIERAQRAKLEEYDLVPVPEEWIKKVKAAVRTGISQDLGPTDLARVVPQYAGHGQDNWLNDETINAYLAIVATHGKQNDRPGQVPSHHSFSNFFWHNLRDKGPTAVTRWAKRAKVGGKNLAYVEKMFVPINNGMHWTLAVIEPTQKTIRHFNSMSGTAIGVQVCQKLAEWVAFELGKDYKKEEWSLVTVGESPQQTNSDDCGVFTVTSARQIMLGYNPMCYTSKQIPAQRVRIVAELINGALLKSSKQN